MVDSINAFRIFGPLEIILQGEIISIESGKLRTLLAALLLDAGSVVGSDRLIDWLWDDHQPANPRGALHTYIRRLRQLLDDPKMLSTVSSGYRLNLGTAVLDLQQFRRLVRGAEETADPQAQAKLLTDALAIWRGPALADVPSESLRREKAAALEEERMTALECRFELEVRLNRAPQIVREIRLAAIDNPYREKFWELLMLALYRAGRQAEALDVYQHVRTLLVDELGIEPGSGLRDLHGRILESDPQLCLPDRSAPDAVTPSTVPAQLPADAIGFVGRQELMNQLTEALRPSGTRPGVPVVVLCGPPGIGKTALAVSLGHRLRPAFPDGQLYVNLRSHERLGQDPPLRPEHVLPQFLRSLGVPPGQIPVELAEQANLFRSKVAGRHVLVMLDNASSIDQVMPLLPGDAGCSVIITSRRHLRGLVASLGAQVVQVGTLSPEESRELVEGMLRNVAVSVDPALVPEVAALCAYLPLALRIAAANLISFPGGHADEYVDSLRTGNRLAALTVDDDPVSAVSNAFALSYDSVGPDDRRLFSLAGLFPGPDFSANAVAVLADTSAAQTRNSLNRLTVANLLQQQAPGRYQFHDLLREYAYERAGDQFTAQEIAAAVDRLGLWYLVGTRNAVDILHVEFLRLPLPPEARAVIDAPEFVDESQAMAWLLAEWRNVLACMRALDGSRSSHLTWHLSDALRGFFWTGRYRTEWSEAARGGLITAGRSKDKLGMAAMHRSLANLYNTLGDYRQAINHLAESIALHTDLGMSEEVAAILNNLSLAHLSLSQVDQAERIGQEALAIAREVGSPRTEAAALGLLGQIHWAQGDMTVATTYITSSLRAAGELGLHHITSYSLRNLGLVREALGDLDAAKSCFSQALEVSTRIDSFYDRSISLYGLALVHHDVGDNQAALEFAEQALGAFQECGDRTFEAETLCIMSGINAERGDWTASIQCARQAFERANAIDYTDGKAYSLVRIALADDHFGRAAAAALHAADAFALVAGTNRITQRRVLVDLGLMYAEQQEFERATECAQRLHAISEETGQLLGAAEAKRIMALVARRSNHFPSAELLRNEAS